MSMAPCVVAAAAAHERAHPSPSETTEFFEWGKNYYCPQKPVQETSVSKGMTSHKIWFVRDIVIVPVRTHRDKHRFNIPDLWCCPISSCPKWTIPSVCYFFQVLLKHSCNYWMQLLLRGMGCTGPENNTCTWLEASCRQVEPETNLTKPRTSIIFGPSTVSFNFYGIGSYVILLPPYAIIQVLNLFNGLGWQLK